MSDKIQSLQELITIVQKGTPDSDCVSALIELGSSSDERLISVYENVIKEGKKIFRYLAIRGLSNIHCMKSSDILFELLEDRDSSAYYESLIALSQMRSIPVEKACGYICDSIKNYQNRKDMAIILCVVGKHLFLPSLREMLYDKDRNIKTQVISIFEEIGEMEISKNLRDHFSLETEKLMPSQKNAITVDNRDDQIRQKIRFLMDSLTRADIQVSSKVSFAFANYNEDECCDELVEILKQTVDSKVCAILIQILGLIGKSRYNYSLKPYLTHKDSRVRANTVEALAATGEFEVVEWIQPMLSDPNNRVCANTAKALWDFGGLRAIDALIKMLEHREPLQRMSAAYALGEIGVIHVIPHLLKALDDPDIKVQKNVVSALGKTGEPEILGKFEEILVDQSRSFLVRKQSAYELMQFSDFGVEGFFRELLNDEKIELEIKMIIRDCLVEMEERNV